MCCSGSKSVTDRFIAKCKKSGVKYITCYKIYRIDHKRIFSPNAHAVLRKSGWVFARGHNGKKLSENFTYDENNPLGIHAWLRSSSGYLNDSRVRMKVRVNVNDIIIMESADAGCPQLVAKKIFIYKKEFDKGLKKLKEIQIQAASTWVQEN